MKVAIKLVTVCLLFASVTQITAKSEQALIYVATLNSFYILPPKQRNPQNALVSFVTNPQKLDDVGILGHVTTTSPTQMTASCFIIVAVSATLTTMHPTKNACGCVIARQEQYLHSKLEGFKYSNILNLVLVSLLQIEPPFRCLLEKNNGVLCPSYRSAKVMWYFDLVESRCKMFHYYGCGGNNNRFDDQYECEISCGPRVCASNDVLAC